MNAPACFTERAKARYEDKIAILDGVCPYELDLADCSREREAFPPVSVWHVGTYLVYTACHYTATQFDNFRALLSFRSFYCGWIKDAWAKKFDKAIVVVGEVSCDFALSSIYC